MKKKPSSCPSSSSSSFLAAIPLHARLRHALSPALFRYGRAVARCPWPYIVLPVLVLGELGAGLMMVEQNDPVVDDANIPRDSQAFRDQARVRRLFPDYTGERYDALELNEDQIMGSLIFTASPRDPGGNHTNNNASVYDEDVIQEIRDVIADVKANVTIEGADGGEATTTLRYEDLCGRRQNSCVVTGERLLAPQFNQMRQMGILTYPKWKLPTTGGIVDLSFALADADSELKRVGVVRVTFKLRHDLQPTVFLWERAFAEFMKSLRLNRTDVVFSASSSVSQELKDDFRADVVYLWLCLAVMAACSVLTVTWGGDVVSTRLFLVPMGVVSPALGLLAALGLLSYCHVQVVEMVWVTPLLVLGKGLSDMNLLMTSWSSRLGRDRGEGEEGEGVEDVEQRVGWVVVEVGTPITVTSLSVSLALCLGYAASSSPGVANFCLYAGLAVMFSYISTMMFGVGCLATHGRRVMSSRHTLTCRVTRPRDQLKKEGKSLCAAFLCGSGGGAAAGEEKNYEDQSALEKACRLGLVRVTGSLAGKVVIGVLFLGVVASSVFGVTQLKHGVHMQTLVSEASYTHHYLQTDDRYFGFSFPVVFVMDHSTRYNRITADLMVRLVDRVKRDPGIQDDFVRCWIVNFLESSSYNLTTEGEDFPGDVVKDFLLKEDMFTGDVVLSDSGERVAASRCYVFTEKSSDQEEMSRLMQRMRKLAEEAGFPVFAYHPVFLNYDQRLSILPTLLRTAGTAVGVVCALHVLFFPELVGVLLTVSGAAGVVLGTVGFMSFLGVPVSYVSLAPLVLNAGFALHFSVYVSAAYLQSPFARRVDRAADAVARAAAPVLLSALCVLGGVLVLLLAESYLFDVLFKVTLLSLLMVIFHCVFFAPIVLSLVGPEKSQEELDKDRIVRKDIIQRLATSDEASNGTVTDTWCHAMAPAEAKIQGVENGSPGHSYVKAKIQGVENGSPRQSHVNGKKPATGIPKADYENVGTCRHGLTSTSFQNAGKTKTVSSGSYYNTPLGQYENWARRTTDSRDVYDLPVSLPSSHSERREGARGSAAAVADTDFGGRSPAGPPGRRNHYVSLPSSGLRGGASFGKEPSSPRASGGGERDAETADMTTVNGLDDVFLDPPDYEPVGSPAEGVDQAASLEGVHHVACTLSTAGTLAATQNYVTENFRDIPF